MATHNSGPLLYSGHGPYAALLDQPISIDIANCVLFDDFQWVANDQTNLWTVVKDTGAAVAIAADTANGELTMTSTATTDNDGASIQGNEIFLPAANRMIAFVCRVKNNDADQSDIMVGLSENFATNPEAVLSANNRIGFYIDDGSARILARSTASGTTTTVDTGVDLTDSTYVDLAFRVEGTSVVSYYINGNKVATIGTNVPATEMAVASCSISGSATGTRATTLDYIGASQTR